MRSRPPVALDKLKDLATVAWLAGILEGEGSFCVIGASAAVSVCMTDEDVVARCADLFGVRKSSYQPTRPNSKRTFTALARAGRAEAIIRTVAPFLGARRRAQCQSCLDAMEAKWTAPSPYSKTSNVSDEDLVRAWLERDPGQSFRSFALSLGCTNRAGLLTRIARLTSKAAFAPMPAQDAIVELPAPIRVAYLAGLLEGEAHFGIQGRKVNVTLQMIDADVVLGFATMYSGTLRTREARKEIWKPTHEAAVKGGRAYQLMESILPWMGRRRSARIRECLAVRQAIADDKQLRADAVNEKYPPNELRVAWLSRGPDGTLNALATQMGVHPQGLKNQLVKLGIYDTPPTQPQFHSVVCGSCNAEVSSKWNKPRVYCSRRCAALGAQRLRGQPQARKR